MQVEMKENQRKTAVAYFRQSSGSDDVSTSIADQIAQCRKWANANGVEIVAEFADYNTPGELYPDTAEARAFCITDRQWQNWRKSRAFTKQYRKNLGELFNFISKTSVDYVIIHERTRLYRSPNNSFLDGFITNEFADRKMAIVEVANNKIDYLNNVIDIAVQKLLATYEMSKIDEKAAQSKRVRAEKKAQGEYFSNAYGVQWMNHKIVFSDEHRKAIRMVFDGVISGKTYGSILNTLNTEFFHLRTVRNGKPAKCFYESSIYNILSNPVYCGYFLENGQYREIANMGCEPIISLHQYIDVQKAVADRKGKHGKMKVATAKGANFLPLSGLLTCGHCGKRLTMVDDRGIVYFCKNTILLKDRECSPSRIRFFNENDDNDFLLMVQALFSTYIYSYYYKLNMGGDIHSSIDQLTAEIANNRKSLETITDLHFNGAMDADVFRTKAAEFSATIKEKENQLLELQSKANEADDNQLDYLRELIDKVKYTETLLDNDTYYLLARATIKNITVFANHITVTMFDGNKFDLPRICGKHRSKKFPYGRAEFDYSNGYSKAVVIFDCTMWGETPKENETTLLDTTAYKIILKH